MTLYHLLKVEQWLLILNRGKAIIVTGIFGSPRYRSGGAKPQPPYANACVGKIIASNRIRMRINFPLKRNGIRADTIIVLAIYVQVNKTALIDISRFLPKGYIG